MSYQIFTDATADMSNEMFNDILRLHEADVAAH